MSDTDPGRSSLHLRLPGWAAKLGWAALLSMAAGAGALAWDAFRTSAKQVVTEGRLQAVLTICDEDEEKAARAANRAPSVPCQFALIRKQLGEATALQAQQAEKMSADARERWQLSVRVSNLQRDVVGLRVAFDRSLQHITDQRTRDAIYDAQAVARDRYDDAVVEKLPPGEADRDPVERAADKVLRQARVPR